MIDALPWLLLFGFCLVGMIRLVATAIWDDKRNGI
jgi:hypothetical protein